MEQKKQICTSDALVTLSSQDYPWLVAHDLEGDTGDQIFYTLHDPMSHYRCRIPELVGRRIQASFHGWMILSKRNPQDIEWFLWNPLVSKLIRLPRMILEDKDYGDKGFDYCCLSSPPDDPGSILLLMRSAKPGSICFVFCNHKRRKRLRRWMEESYSEQINGGVLSYPTCCNGNIYALSYAPRPPRLIQVQITVVEEEQVVINLVPLVNLPWPHWITTWGDELFLKGSCTQLFCVRVCLDREDQRPCDVYLYKLDMGSMVWTEIKDGLKDTVFFVSLADDYINNDLVYSIPPIASELGGGYIHILEDSGDEIYSYNIKDKTISMSSTRCLGLPYRKSISIWTIPEFRLPVKAKYKLDGGHDQLVRSATAMNDDDEVAQMNEAPLLNIRFGVLEIIMRFCVGVEYLNFRATCRLCRLAAPVIQWSNENERKRLQTYSLVSPWLMVIDKSKGIITFTDPMFGDNNTFFMKAFPGLLSSYRIVCSSQGWLLLHIPDSCLVFFNPFTTDIRKLPQLPKSLSGTDISFSFSAPPTSPDCMVVAFSTERGSNVTIHHVGGEQFHWIIENRLVNSVFQFVVAKMFIPCLRVEDFKFSEESKTVTVSLRIRLSTVAPKDLRLQSITK